MKSKYKIFSQYLPYKASKRNSLNPILYLYNSVRMIGAYAYDRKKKVIYVSDYNQDKYYYMSIYQFDNEGWKIIDMEDHDLIIEGYAIHKELSF